MEGHRDADVGYIWTSSMALDTSHKYKGGREEEQNCVSLGQITRLSFHL